MYRNFQLNNKDILNIYELQDEFSLGQVYLNLEQFKKFAKVHCRPLVRSYIDPENNLNTADIFKNTFWYDVLCGKEETAYNGFIEYIIGDTDGFNSKIKTHARSTSVENGVIAECKYLKLKEKLKYISEKIPEEMNNQKTILVLLAICELSHINALEIKDFSFRNENNITESDSLNIKTIPEDKNELILNTASNPYRYRYHDSDVLADGEKIRTVKIKASGVSGKKVIIETYHDNNEKTTTEIILNKDEVVYCNIAGGRIIKFLPDVEQELKTCNGYSKNDKDTIKNNFQSENIGVFAIANSEYGYLTAKNGKLNFLFYEPAIKNPDVRTRLQSISGIVVEMNITENGYQILTENGTVFSKNEEKKLKAVSLNR